MSYSEEGTPIYPKTGLTPKAGDSRSPPAGGAGGYLSLSPAQGGPAAAEGYDPRGDARGAGDPAFWQPQAAGARQQQQQLTPEQMQAQVSSNQVRTTCSLPLAPCALLLAAHQIIQLHSRQALVF